jgi:hypothetical protein
MGGFEQAVRRGVLANLCDAVAGSLSVSSGEGLDIRIAWSRTRPAANTVPSRIFLGSDSMLLIQEAARLFKETAPLDDIEIQGFVTRLARGPREPSGEVTLEGLVDDQLRCCRTGRRHLFGGPCRPMNNASGSPAPATWSRSVVASGCEPAAFPGPIRRGRDVSIRLWVDDRLQHRDAASTNELTLLAHACDPSHNGPRLARDRRCRGTICAANSASKSLWGMRAQAGRQLRLRSSRSIRALPFRSSAIRPPRRS